MSRVRPCMGGWCQALRDKCVHHTSPTTFAAPAERLCDIGREREMHFLSARPPLLDSERLRPIADLLRPYAH